MNRSSVVPLLCVLLLLPAGVVAHGDEGHGDPAFQTFNGVANVAPGGIAELNFEAEEGKAIGYQVESSVRVDVDIHEHAADIVYHARHNDTRTAVDSFRVPHDGTFSLMVSVPRTAEAAEVDLVLEGVFAVVGETAFVEVENSPASALVLVAVGGLVLAFARRP